MGTATAPQPALKNDLAWLIAGYTAAMGEMRQEIAALRREITLSRMGRGDLAELTLAENRVADVEHVLLDFGRKLSGEVANANALRSVEQAVARRLEAAPTPAPAPRHRRPRWRPDPGGPYPPLAAVPPARVDPVRDARNPHQATAFPTC
jgi:hypothetical protein